MSRVGHLTRRFVESIHPRALTAADLAFVRGVLRPAELACWERLGPADRAESVATARAVIAALASCAPGEADWVAVALLHDVGKAETTFGVVRRTLATVAATLAGPARARAWTGSCGRYVNHDELGAQRLRAAGARPEAVSWAAVHHRRARFGESRIPPEICDILAAADGEPRPG